MAASSATSTVGDTRAQADHELARTICARLEYGGRRFQWAEFDLGTATLALTVVGSRTPSGSGVPGSGASVALAVPDVAEAVAEVRAKGATILEDTDHTSVCDIALIADPDGNRVFLHRRHDGTAC